MPQPQHSAPKWLLSRGGRKAQVLAGIFLALSIQACLVLRISWRLIQASSPPSWFPAAGAWGTNASAKEYDCAVFWLRVPKTASTTVMHAFAGPLFDADLFSNLENGPNTCLEGVGGCASHWNTLVARMSAVGPAGRQRRPVPAPPYGVPSGASNNETDPAGRKSGGGRCFPRKGSPSIYCHEYDARTSTLHFGRHRHNPEKNQPRKRIKAAALSTSKPVGYYASAPMLKTHVGLDPSLFGWVLPRRPMVFGTFRDPVDRLLSGFHYGTRFGGGRPGEVQACTLPGGYATLEGWQEGVAKARGRAASRNDTAAYQQLLRKYLASCRNAADNVYVQFLDPNSKDVGVALANLERYVVVGLQSDIDRTLERWRRVVLRNCADHPRIRLMKKVLDEGIASLSKEGVFRKSVVKVVPENNDVEAAGVKNHNVVGSLGSAGAVRLMPPDIERFDPDLQQLIRDMTAEDKVIYKRVLELYHGSQETT